MLLGEIRNYLQQRGSASLSDVATHFDIAPDTARFALDYWQQRGKVRAVNAACGSGGCGGKAVAAVMARTTNGGRGTYRCNLHLFHELGLEAHRADTVNFAINVVIAVN